jgi:hypothetical protein
MPAAIGKIRRPCTTLVVSRFSDFHPAGPLMSIKRRCGAWRDYFPEK